MHQPNFRNINLQNLFFITSEKYMKEQCRDEVQSLKNIGSCKQEVVITCIVVGQHTFGQIILLNTYRAE